MEQRISLITLGVADLQRAVAFYENVVGWKPEQSPPGVVFFDLNGVVFALWPHDELAKDMNMSAGSVPSYRGYSLAHNVRSEAEVDAIFARLKANDATILKQPQSFLGRLLRIFFRPGGTYVGDRLQPILDYPEVGRVSMKTT
jgi:hypothetical protein